MRLTPESKSILDTLLTGGILSAGNISIGPFDEITRLLLKVLIDNYDTLSTDRGVQQAESLLKFYLNSVKQATNETPPNSETSQPESQKLKETTHKKIEPETSKDVMKIPSFEIPANWRLHELKCRSIKGVAPAGEEFPFSFDGKSILLYGPNGSGKSSLLGAVMWVLTGITLTDDPEQKEVSSIHRTSKGAKRGSKIRDWPTIATLPDTNDPSSCAPDSTATIQLKSSDNNTILYLRRIIDEELEISLNEQAWMPCPDLSKYGIKPLDLQLSIVAPTIFGRKAIEDAPNSRKILSLMLGYEPLEDIGALVSKLAYNRTSLFNILTTSTNSDRIILSSKLASLPEFLTKESKLKKKLKTLHSLPKLSTKKIVEIKQDIEDKITKASASLAKILGITKGETPVPKDLDENLIKAIGHLEKGFSKVFPSLSSVAVDTVLPEIDGRSSEEQLNEIEESLQNFVDSAKNKIEERLNWWRKKTEPGSKAELLLLAAQKYYDSSKMECPVCEQSIESLPVKDELESLKDLDPKLLEELKLFFINLADDLNNTVPENIRIIADASPQERLLYDWEALKKMEEFAEMAQIIQDFESPVTKLTTSIEKITTKLPTLIPSDSEPKFLQAAISFISKVNSAYTAFAILRWAITKLASIRQRLSYLIIAPSTENPYSLLSVLSKGKSAAQEIKPLKLILTQLSEIEAAIIKISKNQNKLDTLETLKEPLDSMKKLSKYAFTKTTTIFNEIKDKAINNLKLLYPENSTGLYPSSLVMSGGRDKSIESLLTRGDYDVPGPPFANAGLQRAIALSFLCALFDKHPNGLGFVIFDDPILSLDEDHRESWSALILSPRMQHTQVILATHQMQFLTNCGYHFANGQVVILNHRDRRRRISYQPGNHLDRAAKLIETNWDLIPGVLYNYCEGLLETLDSYSPEGFFIKDNLTKSLNDYEKLSFPNPLASRRQKEIVTYLRKPIIVSVYAGRHEPTKHNVSKPMVQVALNELNQLNNIFLNELKDLQRLKARERKGTVIQIPSVSFPALASDAVFKNPFTFPTIGRAAARPESWVLDSSDEVTLTKFAPHTAIFVCSNTLNPVIRYGQCALLSDEEIQPRDDDLVALASSDGERYLRKLWTEKESYIMQAIHPTKPVPALRVSRIQASMRKVVGVLYNTPLKPVMNPSSKILEWYPFSQFPSKIFSNFKTLVVEGDSLEPVARQGQKVLVDEAEHSQNTSLEQGGLAALEIEDESIGKVIKKVYRETEHWILLSPNPIQAYTPIIIPIEKTKEIKRIWPIRGVLFETFDQ